MRGFAGRELLVVLGIAVAGVLLAGLVALTDWYQHPGPVHAPVVEIVGPGPTPLR